MASQLALLFLRRLQVPVVITDLDQERVDKGLSYVGSRDRQTAWQAADFPRCGKPIAGADLGHDRAGRLRDCDFVIEAVFEEMSIKKQVFADLEKHVFRRCVLATNTSSLSVAQMAADLDHPERVVGFHFFNPVARDAADRDRPGSRDRRGHPRDGLRRREDAEEERRAGQGCGRLRGEPAAAPD